MTDPISEPGCYDGKDGDWITDKDYHASDRVSRSKLVKMLKNPASFNTEDDIGGRALDRGTCSHAMLLEPDRFAAHFRIPPPEANRKTKIGKEAWDKFVSGCGWIDGQPTEYAKHVVGYDYKNQKFYRDDVKALQRIYDKITGHAEIKALLMGPGLTEATYCWNEGIARYRVRLDRRILVEDGSFMVIDYKTTTEADEGSFSNSIAKYNYHVQAAMYLDGVSRATGIKHTRFAFVVASTQDPCEIQFYELKEEALARGFELYNRAKNLYASCLESGEWPDTSGQCRPITLPRWALTD